MVTDQFRIDQFRIDHYIDEIIDYSDNITNNTTPITALDSKYLNCVITKSVKIVSEFWDDSNKFWSDSNTQELVFIITLSMTTKSIAVSMREKVATLNINYNLAMSYELLKINERRLDSYYQRFYQGLGTYIYAKSKSPYNLPYSLRRLLDILSVKNNSDSGTEQCILEVKINTKGRFDNTDAFFGLPGRNSSLVIKQVLPEEISNHYDMFTDSWLNACRLVELVEDKKAPDKEPEEDITREVYI